jgi:hypothetical protein
LVQRVATLLGDGDSGIGAGPGEPEAPPAPKSRPPVGAGQTPQAETLAHRRPWAAALTIAVLACAAALAAWRLLG